MRIKITVSYDGTNYCGWQVQPNGVTVQEKLEQAVFDLTGEKVRVTGSGRTDAGVHALGQVAHFDTQSSIPPERIFKALNTLLPPDIRVTDSRLAPEDFHSVTCAKKKTYRYCFYVSEVENPLKERYAVKLDSMPDLEKMQDCALAFKGEHDFKAYCASGSSVKTTTRTIYDIKVNFDGEYLTLTVTGNGFLYNMVRMMTGVLVLAGYGKIDKAQIETSLSTGERIEKSKTLPSKGLCLMKAEYK